MTLAQASLSARAMSARVSGVTPRVARQLSRTCLLTGTLAASRGRWSVILISIPSSSGRAPPDDLSLSLAIPNPRPTRPAGGTAGRRRGSRQGRAWSALEQRLADRTASAGNDATRRASPAADLRDRDNRQLAEHAVVGRGDPQRAVH